MKITLLFVSREGFKVQYKFKNHANSSLRHRVAKELRTAIINGDLKPGERLKELELAEQMGISRGPIREALRDLEAMGLVMNLPYRETVVADVNKGEVIHLLVPIRLQLELYAIKDKLTEFDESFFDSLTDIVAQMKQAAADGDMAAVVEEDIRFHECIVYYKKSHVSIQIWKALVNHLRIHFLKNTECYSDLNKLPADHDLLIQMLRSGDYAQIQAAWTSHMQDSASLLCFDDE